MTSSRSCVPTPQSTPGAVRARPSFLLSELFDLIILNFWNFSLCAGFVLLNAHLFRDPFVHVGRTKELLFDFHAFPSRPQPHADAPMNCSEPRTLRAASQPASRWRCSGCSHSLSVVLGRFTLCGVSC
jgi:hypothetical protein